MSQEILNCPVCKTFLETRWAEDKIWTYCEECKTSFYFPAYKLIPTCATPDSMNKDKKKGCGCGKCGA